MKKKSSFKRLVRFYLIVLPILFTTTLIQNFNFNFVLIHLRFTFYVHMQ